MNSKTVKAYAKINIALNVLGKENGYHNLDTVVCTVNKYDTITVTKRKDKKILVSFVGRYGKVYDKQEETNAYKTAKLFMDTFNVNGANIEINSDIPLGSGMGGSSADIVGVAYALKKVYKIDAPLKPLVDTLGSDTGYLLKGGFARLTGRGDIVEHISTDIKLYFVVIYGKQGVNSKDAFNVYDNLDSESIEKSNIDELIKGIETIDFTKFDGNIKNGLLNSSIKLNEEIKTNLDAIKNLSPSYYSMTGSGSTVFAIYENLEMARWAHQKLKKKYGDSVELLSSYDPNKPYFLDSLLGKNIIQE